MAVSMPRRHADEASGPHGCAGSLRRNARRTSTARPTSCSTTAGSRGRLHGQRVLVHLSKHFFGIGMGREIVPALLRFARRMNRGRPAGGRKRAKSPDWQQGPSPGKHQQTGFRLRHLPVVKSGISTVRLPSAIDCDERGMTELQAAASYTSIGDGPSWRIALRNSLITK